MSRIQANLVLLLAAAIWGGGFVAQSTAMDTLGPHWFNTLRFLLATLAVLPFALRESARAGTRLTGNDILLFAVTGLSLFAAQTLQQLGIQTTTVTNASFLTGLYVILVPFISLAVLRRNPHWIIWPSALLALGGILLLNGGTVSHLGTGDALVIACALFLAIQIIMTGVLVVRTGRPLTLAFAQFAVGAVGSVLLASTTETVSLAAISQTVPELLYAGLFSSGLAFALQIIGQRYTTASQAAIFLSSEALFGALFGALLLAETLPAIGYVGCAMMFIAMLLVELVPELTRRRTAAA